MVFAHGTWYMLFLSNNLCAVWWREGCTNGGVDVHFETFFKQMCYFLYFLWLFFVHYRIKFRKFAACIFGCRGFLLNKIYQNINNEATTS